MNQRTTRNRLPSFLAAVAAALLVACGGGGGGAVTAAPAQPRNIQAADGAAMAYGKVTITSLVDGTTHAGTADRAGRLALPASGITYPALVKVMSASGAKANFGYIASQAQADVPVNPLTTLAIAIAAQANPAAVTSASQLPATALAQGQAAVKSLLASVFSAFGVDTSIDLLTTPFATDHTGLDLALDALRVKFDALGNPTVCSKVFNTCRALDLSNLDTTPISLPAAELTALDQVPLAACSAVIESLTSTRITSDASLYSADFLNSGLDAAAYRQALAARFGATAATFANPAFAGTDANGNHLFQFDYLNTATNEFAGSVTMAFKRDTSGACVMAGNRLPFWMEVTSQVTSQVRVDGTSSAAVTTAAPVRGLLFRAGGDGFGGAGVQNTVRVGGTDVTIARLEFSLCDAAGACSAPLISMVKGATNNGYYYTPGGVNTLPIVGYAAAGIATPEAFHNGNPNPILVKMFDADGTQRASARLKVRGGYITATEMAALSLPSVANAQAVLATTTDLVDPALSLNIPVGLSVQSVSLASGSTGSQVTSTSRFVLSGASGPVTVSRTLQASTDYRSIQLNAATTGGTPISIKYVWSPTCAGCT